MEESTKQIDEFRRPERLIQYVDMRPCLTAPDLFAKREGNAELSQSCGDLMLILHAQRVVEHRARKLGRSRELQRVDCRQRDEDFGPRAVQRSAEIGRQIWVGLDQQDRVASQT